jgi:chemotaxis protein methyltransferase CheR
MRDTTLGTRNSRSRPTPAASAGSRPEAGPAFQAGVAHDEYLALCERVRKLSGVDLLQYKRQQMERRIRTWASRRGTPDLTAYTQRLAAEPVELESFLDRVTINVSEMWRHPEQFGHVERTIFPELAAAGPVRIWSAGCSYGAEAYTLAALSRAAIARADVSIKGTDLDGRMIKRAREGVFTPADARLAPKDMLKRYFEAREDGGWAAKPELKRLMSFEVDDLLRMPIQEGGQELVFCRNTVIYFNQEARDALHERLVRSLRVGGYLVVGTSERVSNARELGLVSPFPFVYRKTA